MPRLNRKPGTKKRTFLKKKAPEPAPRNDQARQRARNPQLSMLAAGSIETARSRIELGPPTRLQRLSTSPAELSREVGVASRGSRDRCKPHRIEPVSGAKNQVPALKGRAGKAAVDARDRERNWRTGGERLPEVRTRSKPGHSARQGGSAEPGRFWRRHGRGDESSLSAAGGESSRRANLGRTRCPADIARGRRCPAKRRRESKERRACPGSLVGGQPEAVRCWRVDRGALEAGGATKKGNRNRRRPSR